MIIKLNFNDRDIKMMTDSTCNNFVPDQPDRFKVYPFFNHQLQKDDLSSFNEKSKMHYTDSFLYAKIISRYFELQYKTTLMLYDKMESQWCVLVNEH